MRSIKVWPVILILVLVLVGSVGRGQVAQALPPAQSPAGLTIPYPGHLTDEAGLAVVDGNYDFTFTLYDALIAGTLLWSEVQEGVPVQGGSFIVSLGQVNPLPAELLQKGEAWLEVTVRGLGQADFTILSPRQQLRATTPNNAIQAGASCPHDHWGETWNGSGVGLTLNDTSAGNTVMIPGLLAALFGSSTDWAGAWGRSVNNIGVLGESTGAPGVQGRSTNNYGGYFASDNDALDVGLGGAVGRINAADDANSELYLSANGDVAIKLDNDGGANNAFRILNSGGGAACTVDEAGNLACIGVKSAVVLTEHFGWRKLYAVESPQLWLEEIGGAALVDGEATIPFEAIFAETVNLEEDYYVFLTPLSQEPVWLYVTAKTPAGFTVRGVTLNGEAADCSFDYRVVASRLGYEDVRLEQVGWQTEEVAP